MRTKNWMRLLVHACFLLLLPALGSCAFTPRVVSLQHTEPVTTAMDGTGLKGLRVHLADVVDGRAGLESWDSVPVAATPAGYAYRSPSGAEKQAWDAAVRSPDKATPRNSIGSVRNMYGATTASVSSIESPAKWLADALRVELVAHGAELVGPDDCQVSLTVTLRSMTADLHFSITSSLAAQVDLRESGKEPRKAVIRTADTSVGWVGSSWEYYLVMRGAQQKMLWHILSMTAGGRAPDTEAATRDSPVDNPVWSGR